MVYSVRHILEEKGLRLLAAPAPFWALSDVPANPADSAATSVVIGSGAIGLVKRQVGMVESLITSGPQIMGGQPIIRGVRIPVWLIVDFISNGDAVEEILD